MKKLLLSLCFALAGALGFAPALAQTTVICTISTQNLNPSTGVATPLSSCEIPTQGMSVVSIQTSTNTLNQVLSGQVTTDLSNYLTWSAVTAFTRDTTSATSATIPAGVSDGFSVNVAGKASFRVTMLVGTTGAATMTLRTSVNGGSVGGGGGGGGGAVTSVDGGIASIGTTTDVKCAGSASNCTLIALGKTLLDPTTQLPATGTGAQAPAASFPVTLDTTIASANANAATTRVAASLDIASSVTGSAAAAADLSNMPFAVGKSAQAVIVHVTANTATANFEFSADGATAYIAVLCWQSTGSGSGNSTSAPTTTGVWICPVQGTHFKVRQSGAGGVTATVTPVSRPQMNVIGVNISQTLTIQGSGAHDAAISGIGVRTGCRARTSQYATTIVNDDNADTQCDLNGAATVKPYSVSGSDWTATSGTTALTTNTSTQMVALAGVSIRNYATACQFYNTHATVSTTVSVLDGNGGAALWTGYIPAITAALPVVPTIVRFPTPLKGTANTRMDVSLGTTGANVFWNCQGYQAQ